MGRKGLLIEGGYGHASNILEAVKTRADYVKTIRSAGIKLEECEFAIIKGLLLEKFKDDERFDQDRVSELAEEAVALGFGEQRRIKTVYERFGEPEP